MALPASTLKTERLINLVMCLRWARRPLTRADIFRLVPDYGSDSSESARMRMFERDKDELRAAGYNIGRAPVSVGFDDDEGYVLHDAPAGSPLTLSSADRMYLSVAGNVWTHTHTHHAALRALHKLGVPSQSPAAETSWGALGIVGPHVADAVDACVGARQARAVVEFSYRGAGEVDARNRTVSPWSLGLIAGSWYLAGFDADRQDRRVFRLDRMTSVPVIRRRAQYVGVHDDFSWAQVREEIHAGSSVTVRCLGSQRAAVDLESLFGAVPENHRDAASDLRPLAFSVISDAAAVEQLSRYGSECIPLSPADVVQAVSASWRVAVEAHSPDVVEPLTEQQAERALAKAQVQGVAIPGAESSSVGVHRTEESALERSLRLMTMVPWLLTHQGVDVAAAARHFGVTPAMIDADLQVLFLCGTPGGLPGDLIEATWDDGRIYVDNADALGVSLTLTAEEGWPLWVGLQVLAAHVKADSPEAAAIARLQGALAEQCGLPNVDQAVPVVAVEPVPAQVHEARALCEAAIVAGDGVEFVYSSHHSQSLRVRRVRPVRVKHDRGHWYVEAWDQGVLKDFRLDRARDVRRIDAAPMPPIPAQAAARWQLAIIEVEPSASAVAEYFGAVPVDRARAGQSRRYVVGGYRWEWLVAQVLSSQGTVRVLYPPSLRFSVWQAASLAAEGLHCSHAEGSVDQSATR